MVDFSIFGNVFHRCKFIFVGCLLNNFNAFFRSFIDFLHSSEYHGRSVFFGFELDLGMHILATSHIVSEKACMGSFLSSRMS